MLELACAASIRCSRPHRLMLCMRLWWIFAFDSSEYRSYRALSYAFQKLLPQFSNFSAIKLMARVCTSDQSRQELALRVLIPQTKKCVFRDLFL
eukprot:4361735-Amphidinium_carterae.1